MLERLYFLDSDSQISILLRQRFNGHLFVEQNLNTIDLLFELLYDFFEPDHLIDIAL
jgi:hypothetical protein